MAYQQIRTLFRLLHVKLFLMPICEKKVNHHYHTIVITHMKRFQLALMYELNSHVYINVALYSLLCALHKSVSSKKRSTDHLCSFEHFDQQPKVIQQTILFNVFIRRWPTNLKSSVWGLNEYE